MALTNHSQSPLPSPLHSSHATFPIIAVAIIGILATAFLLVSYYIFVIKCCLNWHRIDLLRRFSFSRRRRVDDHPPAYPPAAAAAAAEARGLNDAAIRSIPIFIFKKPSESKGNGQNPCDCAVCLNEFHDAEKLRILPNCAHIFHIDCIDVWLQNNANCPLCRTSISPETKFPVQEIHSIVPLQDPSPRIGGNYVVIEIGRERNNPDNPGQDRAISGEVITASPVQTKQGPKKVKKMTQIGSMGDEWIEINRNKDEQFLVQPIRRSFSMDSANDSQLYLAVQEIMQRRRQGNHFEVSPSEGSSRCKKSFFSFGQGRGASRSAVQPV